MTTTARTPATQRSQRAPMDPLRRTASSSASCS